MKQGVGVLAFALVLTCSTHVCARAEPSLENAYVNGCIRRLMNCLQLFSTEVGPTPLYIDFPRFRTESEQCERALSVC